MQAINYIRKNPGLFLSLVAVVIFEIYYYSNHAIADGKYVDLAAISETNLLRIFLLGCLGYFIVFRNEDRRKSFKAAITVSVALMAAGSIWLFTNYPRLTDLLAREDDVVENMSAGFLFLASAAAMATAVRAISSRQIMLASLLGLMSVVLFVIGMEEISWMQRILGIESSGAFLENNSQQETNFHNFHTILFENMYYIGAFIVLTILPSYYHRLTKSLSKLKLKKLAPLLPSPWLLVPFAVMAGFVKSSEYYHHPLLALAIPLTILFLAKRLATYYSRANYLPLVATIASLIIVFVSALVFLLTDYYDLGIRRHVATEYRELFIAIGLFAYIVDTRYKLMASSLTKTHKSRARK